MKYQLINSKKHYVFESRDEFREYYLSKMIPVPKVVEDWRNGKEKDWVLSDDDNIVQLLKVSTINHPNDRKNYKYSKGWCRTVVGTFLMNNNTKMDTDFSAHKNRYTFSKTIGKKNNVKKRKIPTKKEKIFTTSIVAGHGPVKAYMDAFGEQNDKSAKRKAVILLKQERIVKEIEKSVMDVAKENGLDHQFVLRKLKHLAEYSEDDNITLQSVKEIGKIIGTTGTTVKQREMGVIGMFQGFSPEQIESADRESLKPPIQQITSSEEE